jgi:hypothetical protein
MKRQPISSYHGYMGKLKSIFMMGGGGGPGQGQPRAPQPRKIVRLISALLKNS